MADTQVVRLALNTVVNLTDSAGLVDGTEYYIENVTLKAALSYVRYGEYATAPPNVQGHVVRPEQDFYNTSNASRPLYCQAVGKDALLAISEA